VFHDAAQHATQARRCFEDEATAGAVVDRSTSVIDPVKPQLVRVHVFDATGAEPDRDKPIGGARDDNACTAAQNSSMQHRADRFSGDNPITDVEFGRLIERRRGHRARHPSKLYGPVGVARSGPQRRTIA
jgi:hypothetical protein